MPRFSFFPLAAVLCVLLGAYALLVPLLNPDTVNAVNLGSVYQPPGIDHWFGTDQLGRDIWARTAAALRISLLMALGAAVVSTALGILAAAAAVTAGKLVDKIITRLIDALNAVPHLLLSVVILSLWPGQIWAIVLSIALTHWTQTARVLRSKLLSERESGYVRLSVALGARNWALWRTHLIPAVLPQVGIAFALQIPHAMWHESALSFLGVGLPAQSASLGLLLEDARSGILAGAWWLLVFPATALIIASWAVATSLRISVHDKLLRRWVNSRDTTPTAQPQNTVHNWGQPQHVSTGLRACASVKAGEHQLVKSVEISAQPGTIHALMGPSGAGKTLFLRAVAGLLPGHMNARTVLEIAGKSFSNALEGRHLGRQLVFIPGSAATALNPVRTLRHALRRAFRQHSRPAAKRDLANYWRQFGLDAHLLDHYPHQLSGGQAQRALMALGLVGDPKAILLDEPTSALDQDTRAIVASVLRNYAQRGATILVVTHDPEFADAVANEVHFMNQGQLVARDEHASSGESTR